LNSPAQPRDNDDMKIQRAAKISGRVVMPGDKSISHRAALIGAAAEGRTDISNFATSADCASTLSCLRSLGVKIDRKGRGVSILGRGKEGFLQPDVPLDCGNSGTTARLLAGLLAGHPVEAVLEGDRSLSSRPMDRITRPLELMGAEVRTDSGTLPMTVRGSSRLAAIEYRLPVSSAQVKSCVLLAGLRAQGKTTVLEPPSDFPGAQSRDHTERMLDYLGARVDVTDVQTGDGSVHRISVEGFPRLEGAPIEVPGDISSAAFFLVAAACLEGSALRIEGVGLNPTRSAFIGVLRGLGARIEIEDPEMRAGEPVGNVVVSGGLDPAPDHGIISGSMVANLIDELPVLAVLGTQLQGGIEVRDASELRKKESDRIAAVVRNLRSMGADVTEFPDGFRVGRSKLTGAAVRSFGDHRIAMAFAIAGLFAKGETEIEDPNCVGVSFPGFFEVLDGVVC